MHANSLERSKQPNWYRSLVRIDFGANYLFTKYKDEKIAKQKVRERCYTLMKAECDLWFAMGTHSLYPFLKWMIVGLLWMKKPKLRKDLPEKPSNHPEIIALKD